jgi:hypothetical protein
MAVFKFLGRVLPPRARVTLTDLGTIHWKDAALGLEIDMTVKMIDSKVEVVCDSNLYATEDDGNQVYMRAFDAARAAVNSFCFATGLGLSVVLEKVIKPDGIEHDILVQRPELAAMFTAFEALAPNREQESKNFSTMYGIVLGNSQIFMALDDLIVSISLPHYAPINCARAIETLRQVMTPEAEDRKQGWETMRQNLNISLEYLSFITNVSTGPRHGVRVGTTQIDFQETIKRAWTVMNRFLEYKKRGDQPLPLTDFPLLECGRDRRPISDTQVP